jgi:hypothetical protein
VESLLHGHFQQIRKEEFIAEFLLPLPQENK